MTKQMLTKMKVKKETPSSKETPSPPSEESSTMVKVRNTISASKESSPPKLTISPMKGT